MDVGSQKRRNSYLGVKDEETMSYTRRRQDTLNVLNTQHLGNMK